jgi:hypothetical protein
MSAVPPIASKFYAPQRMRLCARSRREQAQQTAHLFDHLVGASKHRCRYIEAERFGGFEVDAQFKLRRLLNRQVRRFGSTYQAPRVNKSDKVAPYAMRPPASTFSFV